MSSRKLLRTLIDALEVEPEMVRTPDSVDLARAEWRHATAQARTAYRDWSLLRDAESYARYRAACDQEDAAHDALVSAAGGA